MNMKTACNTSDADLARNMKKTQRYRRIRFVGSDDALKYPPCAVVGGGPGLKAHLDELREFKGDIYAVNDTAGYLSDEGIPCFMYSIDASRYLYKTGELVKGAIFASRVHKKQFSQFEYDNVATFDMGEDVPGGITGGPTAVCRAPYLFLRMGYRQVVFFGCDACFYDSSHASGEQKAIFDNMIIITAGGVDYLTNGSLLLQSEWLVDNFRKHPKFLVNRSDGLLKAMLEHYDTWSIRAISSDLKKQYDDLGWKGFDKEINLKEQDSWQQQLQAG